MSISLREVSYLERWRRTSRVTGHDLRGKCGDESLIVYYRHEVVYLYSDLEGFCLVLEELGYEAGKSESTFPMNTIPMQSSTTRSCRS
jgi:hypothetical protein